VGNLYTCRRITLHVRQQFSQGRLVQKPGHNEPGVVENALQRLRKRALKWVSLPSLVALRCVCVALRLCCVAFVLRCVCVALRCVCVALRLCCVVLCCVVLRYVCITLRLCYVTLRCVALHCIALRCVALRCVALRCVALRYIAKRFACCLRSALLWLASLRFATPKIANFTPSPAHKCPSSPRQSWLGSRLFLTSQG